MPLDVFAMLFGFLCIMGLLTYGDILYYSSERTWVLLWFAVWLFATVSALRASRIRRYRRAAWGLIIVYLVTLLARSILQFF